MGNESAFRKANPGHDIVKVCLYVGMTGLDPDLRFDRHMAGLQANRFVLKRARQALAQPAPNPLAQEAAQAFMARVARIDTLACPQCKTGRLRVVVCVAGAKHLPLPGTAPPGGQARGPP
ncbi:hypothetical protein DBR42_26480 [Pelomonas sp. HMWF004]|nr:hypothetical protein DBR42_26480 [Pelomonas sp. HMWF004]